jgi:RNA polymerase primary sigma factor
MRQYKYAAIRQLRDQQVRYAPVERRLEQLDRAEKLVAELVPGKLYPYQFVCYRVTNFRSDQHRDLRIEGRDLEHDLSLFIQDLSATVPAVPAEAVPEPVFTLEQVSKDLHVSTKTISRWRDRGLVTRWILCDGKRKVGIRQSLLQRFLARNQERVQKSSRFSQLTEPEKAEILRRAKRLAARAPDRFTEICRRIAKKVGRSVETIRYTIKKHDQAHPGLAIFKDQTGPLDDQAKQSIYSSYRRGFSINALAERYHRTRTSVYRIINEIRARRLLDLPLAYIDHASFDDEDMEAEILGPMPGAEAYAAAAAKARTSVPKDVPPELAPLYEVPLLNREQEAHLFRRMNFLKHQANRLREGIDPSRARTTDLDRLEELIRQAMAVKDQLIRANMRLVASIAKRHAGQNDNYFELLSDGNLSLIKAVEKFDFSRGNKFSTYASWAIMKNFARSLPEEKVRRDRFLTGYEEMFEAAADSRSDEQELLFAAQRRNQEVSRLLALLEPRERRIIELRYGLNGESNHTLEQVGKQLDITKERVRQLEARTMSKLERLSLEEHVEL